MGIVEDFNAVKLPAVAVMLLGILTTLLVLVPVLAMIMCISLPLIWLGYAAVGWIGAQRNLTLKNTVIVVTVVSIVTSTIEYALSFILNAVGFNLNITVLGRVVDLTPHISASYILGGIITSIMAVIESVILAAIGHFVYGILNKKK
ncbi:MAG: hypothetical protein NTY68_03080 [Candidatus Micrarchaeota archaeon]|nr:hypothetical protein [Candidatus Micrarchaeota archaeon]